MDITIKGVDKHYEISQIIQNILKSYQGKPYDNINIYRLIYDLVNTLMKYFPENKPIYERQNELTFLRSFIDIDYENNNGILDLDVIGYDIYTDKEFNIIIIKEDDKYKFKYVEECNLPYTVKSKAKQALESYLIKDKNTYIKVTNGLSNEEVNIKDEDLFLMYQSIEDNKLSKKILQYLNNKQLLDIDENNKIKFRKTT